MLPSDFATPSVSIASPGRLGYFHDAGVTETQAVPREWSGFRAFLQSDFQAARFWFKHAQLALNFVLAATFVLLSDGLPWQQVARVALNLVAVLAVSYLLVRTHCEVVHARGVQGAIRILPHSPTSSPPSALVMRCP